MLVALVAGLVWGLGQVLGILSPVLLAAGDRRRAGLPARPGGGFHGTQRRFPAARHLCVFGLALVFVAALFGSVVPQLINEASQLVSRIPAYAARVEKRAEYWLSHPPPLVQRLLEREQE